MSRRRLGVYGENLPTKKGQSVVASDFLIAGMVARFERKFDRAFAVTSPEQLQRIFGLQVLPGAYGWDAATGFFANTAGVNSTLWVSSHVGYDGTEIDATVAELEVDDTQGSPESILRISAAYQDTAEYGVSGNRTGFRIETGSRFETEVAAGASSTDNELVLDSVSGIHVGDIIMADISGGATYHKITGVDEGSKKVLFATDVGGTGASIGDAVTVPGFRVQMFRKSVSGVEQQVDRDLASIWLTTEPEVTEFYAPAVFESSSWAKIDVLSTGATLEEKMPAAVASTVYMAGGTDGTAPSTPSHWERALNRLDNRPVRMICNPETTLGTVQRAMEVYCKGRDDNPKVIVNIPENRTEAQLKTIGQAFQRSDDVLAVIVANWLEVVDPFNASPVAPFRRVPNVGHVMGRWVWAIGTKGVHYIPSTADAGLLGVEGVVGDQFENDQTRTRLSEAGINVIQERPGYGIIIRNFFTPSTAKEFQFANGILMRDFIKVSVVQSLQDSENKPNSLDRIKMDNTAIFNFLYRLWEVGSTGTVPRGETFGQSFRQDGSASGPGDHFEVVSDIVNNPVSEIEAGNRNHDIWFSYPAPAGSIRIGVGILLRG